MMNSQVFLEGFTGEAFLGLFPEALRQLEVDSVEPSGEASCDHAQDVDDLTAFFCIYRKVEHVSERWRQNKLKRMTSLIAEPFLSCLMLSFLLL